MRFLLACVLAACSSSSNTVTSAPFASAPQPIVVKPDPRATTLRVMTYNVNFGLRGDRSGIDAVRKVSPDLVLLQET
ncbi:MAG: endonuclease/exonuclease/phosphatase family protein, partial [Deltaproteobacteria bacterium]|nr:endonuclease/exonuclease/phosphatase family protein [Deltaproteobacteria bacterium]